MVLMGAGRGQVRVGNGSCNGDSVKVCRDSDGDLIVICMYSGSCPYKKVVKDADNDYLELCGK